MHTANLAAMLDDCLPVGLRHVVYRIRDVANTLGVRAALVGGVPREMARIRLQQFTREQFMADLRDFDVVVEGDGVRFAYELYRRLPGQIKVNQAFSTATLVTEDPAEIDIASARREDYPIPGQLPVVEPGVSIESDLLRRDFSINAVAIDVSEDFGRLIDSTGGIGDIKARLVRTLSTGSFYDDPTRLFRALRYTMRLGYDLEPTTKEQLLSAIIEGNMDFVSPERVRYELECTGNEPRWADIWQALAFSGLMRSVHPALEELYSGWQATDARALDIAIKNNAEVLEQEEIEPWLIRTAWALGAVDSEQLESACQRLGIFARQIRWLRQARALLREAGDFAVHLQPPSLATRLLQSYSRQAVTVAVFTMQPRSQEEAELRKTLFRYITDWSLVRSELSSAEMMSMGLRPGRSLGELRDRLRYLRLDGLLADLDAERDYARRFISDLLEEEDESAEIGLDPGR
ncbi:CCA tRNA nucleotidyltransferase [bacterium]|nr:CCA tRNA nucleotidyltransferase [bacterium]